LFVNFIFLSLFWMNINLEKYICVMITLSIQVALYFKTKFTTS
jgi:hypothetical protein